MAYVNKKTTNKPQNLAFSFVENPSPKKKGEKIRKKCSKVANHKSSFEGIDWFLFVSSFVLGLAALDKRHRELLIC